MSRQPDYYVILGVERDATADEIREAAAALAGSFPENAREPSVNAAFRQLVEAYEVLSDPQRRAAYDEERYQQAPELLEVIIQPSRRKIGAMDTKQLLYLMLMLRAPADRKHKPLPVNLALVFDRSTSMRGQRLERVKMAVQSIVEKLSPTDLISVVSFSDRANVVSPSAYASDREAIVRRMMGVRTSGGTEIYQGLQAGVQELRKATLSRYANYLILMTDGHTYGDEEKCLTLADEIAREGVTTNAFGIGTDWNEDFLDQLVAPSAGHAVYIDRPSQIITYLKKQINGLGAVYAHNVRLHYELPRGVRCRYAFKVSPFSQPLPADREKLRLGSIEVRAPLIALFELVIEPQKPDTTLTIPFRLQADIPGRHLHDRDFNYRHPVDVVHDAPGLAPAPIVLRAVQMLNLHRMSEKAWEEFSAGKADRATKRMELLTTRLMEAGHRKLAAQAAREKERLTQMGSLSPAGKKRLKYGTRSLMNTAISPRFDD